MSSFRGTNLTLCSRNNKFMIIGLEDFEAIVWYFENYINLCLTFIIIKYAYSI